MRLHDLQKVETVLTLLALIGVASAISSEMPPRNYAIYACTFTNPINVELAEEILESYGYDVHRCDPPDRVIFGDCIEVDYNGIEFRIYRHMIRWKYWINLSDSYDVLPCHSVRGFNYKTIFDLEGILGTYMQSIAYMLGTGISRCDWYSDVPWIFYSVAVVTFNHAVSCTAGPTGTYTVDGIEESMGLSTMIGDCYVLTTWACKGYGEEPWRWGYLSEYIYTNGSKMYTFYFDEWLIPPIPWWFITIGGYTILSGSSITFNSTNVTKKPVVYYSFSVFVEPTSAGYCDDCFGAEGGYAWVVVAYNHTWSTYCRGAGFQLNCTTNYSRQFIGMYYIGNITILVLDACGRPREANPVGIAYGENGAGGLYYYYGQVIARYCNTTTNLTSYNVTYNNANVTMFEFKNFTWCVEYKVIYGPEVFVVLRRYKPYSWYGWCTYKQGACVGAYILGNNPIVNNRTILNVTDCCGECINKTLSPIQALPHVPYCGDYICDSPLEDATNCPMDCAPYHYSEYSKVLMESEYTSPYKVFENLKKLLLLVFGVTVTTVVLIILRVDIVIRRLLKR